MTANQLQKPPGHVAVIGTGVIGSGWIARFLAAGLKVSCYDPAPGAEEKALKAIRQGLSAMGVSEDRIEALAASLSFETSLSDAVSAADWIQENGPENEAIKRDLLARIEAACPQHAIIATSTSSLSLEKLGEGLARPQNVIVGHPFLPVTLVRVVEIAGELPLQQEALAAARSFYTSVGSIPITCRPIPGLVVNRLQAALMREAMYLLSEDVASGADIDQAVTEVLGPRWSATGPFVSHALAGGTGDAERTFAVLGDALRNLWAGLGSPQLDEDIQASVVAGCVDAMGGHDVSYWTKKRECVAHAIRDAAAAEEEARP